MQVLKYKVSAVSYTNTKPFIYGLRHHAEVLDMMELSLDIPSLCAQKLINRQVDIGLVPVAVLSQIPDYQIISNYCIGANGAVNSVFIFSQKPIEQVQKIKLDIESRTSNLLAQVLLKFHWQQKVLFTDEICEAEILIGDRTFGRQNDFAYVYDLAQIWKEFTQLPFVFAAWVANRPISDIFIEKFNLALADGLKNRVDLLKTLPKIANFDLEDYLMRKIDFDFDENKRKALNLFLNYIEKL